MTLEEPRLTLLGDSWEPCEELVPDLGREWPFLPMFKLSLPRIGMGYLGEMAPKWILSGPPG